MAARNTGLQLRGERQTGQDVRTDNITAVTAISNIIKSSLGPVGLDKMIVDDIGDFIVTNDGATILKKLEVQHPAAKLLVEISDQQDEAIGDGTTSVVLLAAELLKRGGALVQQKVHPTTIIAGYRMAMKEACRYIKEKQAIDVSSLPKDTLLNIAKTSMSSKIADIDSELFANIVVQAVQSVKTIDVTGGIRYPVSAVNMLKAHGRSVHESKMLDGYALNQSRAAQGMVKTVQGAKIACVDFNLQKTRMALGVQIVVEDTKELQGIRDQEQELTKQKVQKILDSGANVILTTKGIDDMCLKYFVEAGAMAVRRVPNDDMKRICRVTGATLVTSMADMEAGETFDKSSLGHAECVGEQRVSDDDIIVIKGAAKASACSILLRGANDYLLDEMERSLHDALCTVRRVLESGSVVPGGGSVEAALSIALETYAESMGTREQLAVAEFAQALLVIPKTLAVNAAVDATDLVAKLRAYHHSAQNNAEKAKLSQYGLDLFAGSVVNCVEAGVLEPAIGKIKMLQFATEAALTILRIDDMIQVEPEQNEEDQ